MYSAFRLDKPAVQSVSMVLVTIWEGAGKVWVVGRSEGGLKRETNLACMDFAAAPETNQCPERINLLSQPLWRKHPTRMFLNNWL